MSDGASEVRGVPGMLPIHAHREAIEAALRTHPVVIVAGETGSGKTTQIPQFCLAAGRGRRGMVGCTQPRRVAAVTVAERVAEELGSPVGGLVGWQHRFGRRLSPQTRIKFMTDGILLAETRADPELRRYDTLLLDEAHERTLQTDFLLGYLRGRLARRRDLKAVISSATLDVAKFRAFFGGAPVITVPGKLHPVEVRYRPPGDEEDDLARQVADAAVALQAERDGDILVFLPGERDIRAAAEALRGRVQPETDILPFLANLPPAEQRRVFRLTPGRRRIVLATNVAETSLTIPGIRMVIDSGLARISRYTHRTRTQRLHIEPVSRASAEQRRGRCGRLGPGVCVRLYSEEDFLRRDAHTEPEIRRSSLAGVLLTMADLRLGRIEEYPLPDPPSPGMVREGHRELFELAALDEAQRLTPLGRQLAKLPIEPRLARMLLAAAERKTLRDALVVVAALACDEPRLRPAERAEEADRRQAAFRSDTSDFAALLRLWRWYRETACAVSRSAARRLCGEQFLSFRRMEEWADVREQLERAVRTLDLDPEAAQPGDAGLHLALLSGMLSQIGLRDPDGADYRGARGLRFAIHPGSGLFAKPPPWVMAAELVDTTRLYARRVAAIRVEWLEAVGAHLCRRSWHSPFWDARNGTARALERVTLHGLLIADGRRRDYSRIDPKLARELLIRHGLVGGELPAPVPSPVARNLELFASLREARHKLRGGDAAADDERFFEACDRVLPSKCVNLAALRAWLRDASAEEVAQFVFKPSDFASLVAPRGAFPDAAQIAGEVLPLDYRHAPGREEDGITCTVPLRALPLLRRWRHEWLVPGALPGKLAWLLGRLPRAETRRIASDPGVLERLSGQLGAPAGPLAEALSAALRRSSGVDSPPALWGEDGVPPAFRVRFRIVTEDGQEAFVTRDPEALTEFEAEMARLGALPAPPVVDGRERGGLVVWDAGGLPEEAVAGAGGWPIVNYPAWIDRGSDVALGWFSDRREAQAQHRGGVRRLYLLALGTEGAGKGAGTLPRDVRQACRTLGCGADRLWSEAFAAALDAVLLPPEKPLPRTAEDFHRRLAGRRVRLLQAARIHYREAQACLVRAAGLERQIAEAALPEETVMDLDEQLGWLVYPGFCRHVPPERMAHYGRYLEGMRLRMERALLQPARDLERLRRLRPFWERYRCAAQLPPREALPPRALDAYRWAVEEFRVSLFAQELRTPAPVSAPRLERLWEAAQGAAGKVGGAALPPGAPPPMPAPIIMRGIIRPPAIC